MSPSKRWPAWSRYVKEIVPLFLAGAALMFVLDQTGILERLITAIQPLVTSWLGLPPQAGAAFLMGFLRRDFGATGLFVMESQGLLSPAQVVVAMVTVTLLIPCIASVMVIGVLYTMKQIPIFEAKATLIIESNPPRVLTGVNDVVELGPSGYWFQKEYFQTQYNIIKSREVAHEAAETLGLFENPSRLGMKEGTITEVEQAVLAKIIRALGFTVG